MSHSRPNNKQLHHHSRHPHTSISASSVNTVTSDTLTNNSFITVQVNRKISRALLDTGSHHSLVSSRFARSHHLAIKPLSAGQTQHLFAANSSRLEVLGTVEVEPRIKGLIFPITAMVIEHLSDDFLLGTDFISLYNVVLDYQNHIITLDDLLVTPLINSDNKQRVVRTAKCMCIPARSEALIPVSIHKRFVNKQLLVEPMPGRQFDQFALARSINYSPTSDTVCRILNYSDTALVLTKGQSVAFITECVSDDHIHPLSVNRMSSEIIDNTKPDQNSSKPSSDQLSDAELDAFLSEHHFNISSKADTETKYKLARLLFEFQDIFASEVTEMKSYTGPPFEVTLNSSQGSYRRQFKLSQQDASEVERQIQAMREANVIEPSVGTDSLRFNSPIFLVAKSDKSKRAVLDLRGINKLIEPVVVNLPPINDIVADVAATKSQCYSKIDMLSYFWQIGLAPGISRSITTMTSPATGEKWQYTRAPYGLKVSSGFSQLALLNTIGHLITRFA
ncbi:MAG TPA: retropepsin-like aspartic protease [Methylomicrobium sp.]|nr:retropepsin-like aspartic protease [Methylomicrobium sp.]